MARSLHLVWALLLGACFSGVFLAGQPCVSDADCGPQLRCEDGVCGGRQSGQTTGVASTSTTVEPTTTSTTSTPTTSSSTGDPSTSTTDPVTSSSSSTTDDSTTGPTCGLGRCKDIDLLFVVDNSPSMSDDFDNLISALGPFSEHLLPILKQTCSIHLGVVATDEYKHNPPECQQLGNLVRATDDDNPCTFKEGLPYATLADLGDPTSLACILTVGSDGNADERPIDALFQAIDPDVNDSACNQGFYRPDALLAVVLATDEDDDDSDAQGHDGSYALPTNTWFPLLSNAKPGGVDDLYFTAFLGDEDPAMANCSWEPLLGPDGLGNEHAPVLRSFIQKFDPGHHAIGSLCKTPDPANYEPLIKEIADEIIAACQG